MILRSSLLALALVSVVACSGTSTVTSTGIGQGDAPSTEGGAGGGDLEPGPGASGSTPTPPETCTITTGTTSGQWDPAFVKGERKMAARLEARRVAVFADDGGLLLAGDEDNGIGTGFTNDALLLSLDATGKERSTFGVNGLVRLPSSASQGKLDSAWASASKSTTFVVDDPTMKNGAFRIDATGAIDTSFGSAGKLDLSMTSGHCYAAGVSGGAALLTCNDGHTSTGHAVVIDPDGKLGVFPRTGNAMGAVRDADGTWLAVIRTSPSVTFIERWSRDRGQIAVAAGLMTVPVSQYMELVFPFTGKDGRFHILGSGGSSEGDKFYELALDAAGALSTVTSFVLPVPQSAHVERLCDGRIVMVQNVYPSSSSQPHTLKVSHFDAAGHPFAGRGNAGVTQVSVPNDVGYNLDASIDRRTGRVVFAKTDAGYLWIGQTLP